MDKQWLSAAGYLAIFLMPALLLLGALVQEPWLAFGVAMLVFPLARVAFGAMPVTGAPEWRERIATLLHSLPLVFACVLPACVLIALALTARPQAEGGLAMVGFGLSLWMTLLFGTCVAHELIHRRDRRHAMVGNVLAGFCGYPVLGSEHLAHHARPGDTHLAEYPLKGETVWAFAARRARRIAVELLGPGASTWRPGVPSPTARGTRFALLVTALTWISFTVIAGTLGATLYLAVMLGVVFGVQLITYIQHWGLGDDSIPDRMAYGRGWEDDCRFQAWVTLSLSLHDQHHRDSRRPFYRIDPSPDSPRLPAGYVLLMFASLVPPVWRRVMAPAYEYWLASPTSPLSAGHRLTCFGLPELRSKASA